MSGISTEGLNQFTGMAMDSLWRASWQGAILIAAVWVLGRVWKRMPNGLRCTLWLIVCMRLLVSLTPAAIAIPCLPSKEPSITVVKRSATALPSEPVPQTELTTPVLSTPASVPIPQAHPGVSGMTLILGLWLVGAAMFAGFPIRQLFRSVRLVRSANACADADLMAEIRRIGAGLGIRSIPRILVTDQPVPVQTIGVIRPVVLLSSCTLASCSPDEWQMVAAHELAHIRRGDALMGLIPQLAHTVFFFHPLVWLACREFDIARESACDELALSSLNVGSDLYGRLLLKLGTRHRSAATLCTPGVSSHFHLLRRRIAMLENANESTPPRLSRRIKALVGLACLLCIAPLSLVAGQNSVVKSVRVPLKVHGKSPSKVVKTVATNITKKSREKSPEAQHVLKGNTTLVAYHKLPAVRLLAVQPTAKQAAEKPTRTIKIFVLKNAKADAVARILNDVFSIGKEKAGKASSDDYTNGVIVSADESMVPQISKVIASLDVMAPAKKRQSLPQEDQTTVYKLRYSDAQGVVNILNDTFGLRVRVAGDNRTNSVVVTADSTTQTELRQVIVHLDVPTPPADISSSTPKHNKLYKIPASMFKDFANIAGNLTHERFDSVSYGNDENFFIVRGTDAQLRAVDDAERKLREKN